MDIHADEVAIEAGAHRTLASNLYTDQAVFDAEMETIIARSWQLVGHQTEVPNKGDFMTAEVAGEDILIMRGDDGELRAFYNICVHRGHRLAEGRGNRRTMVCPYHAWCYDMRGRLKSAPHIKNIPGFKVADHTLKAMALELLQGLIYVNLNPDAAPFAASLGTTSDEIHEYLPNLPECHFAHRTERVLKANWKIVVENYSECYHCALIHKTFTEGIVKPEAYRIINRGVSQLHCSLAQPKDKAAYGYNPDHDAKTDIFAAWYLWPLSAVQVYPGGIGMTFRWIPLGPDETKVEVDWWLSSPLPNQIEHELIEQHETTTFIEDIPLVESVQRNQHSRGFKSGFILVDAQRGHMSEHGVKAFKDIYETKMGTPT